MTVINQKSLKLAVMALQEDVPELTEESLKKVLGRISSGVNDANIPKIFRRKDLVHILGISLREVDRLIAPTKENGKVIAQARIPTIQIGPRAIGILQDDLLGFLNKNRRVS